MNQLGFSSASDSTRSATGLLQIYRSWRRTNPVQPFVEFVQRYDVADGNLLIELATLDLIHQISTGFKVRAESYLRAAAVLQTEPDFMLDLIDAEVCARADRGETIDPQDLIQRFPQLQDKLLNLLEMHELDLEASDSLRSELGPTLRFGHFKTVSRINAVYDLWHGVDDQSKAPVLILRLDKPQGLSEHQLAKMIQLRRDLDHPHIARLIDSGTIEQEGSDYLFLIFEPLNARTMADVLDDPSCQMNIEPKIASWLIQLVDATDKAMGRLNTPVQFDLDHLLICRHPSEPGQVPILLGIPQLWLNSSLPEHLLEFDLVRSFGLLLFAVCLQETELDEVKAHVNSEFKPVKIEDIDAEIPSELCAIYLCCVQPKSKRRYRSVTELIEDLHRYETGRPLLATKRLRRWF